MTLMPRMHCTTFSKALKSSSCCISPDVKGPKDRGSELIPEEMSVPVRSSPYRPQSRTACVRLLPAAFDKVVAQQIQKPREA